MWEQYRKTFIPVQALILTVCAILHWGLRIELHSIVTVFVVMEAGALYGASMGHRWSRRMVQRAEALPLSRR